MEQNRDAQRSGEPQETEKSFTQEEVNKIVQDRLARAKKDLNDFEAREKEMKRRELILQAKEMLSDKGIPKELAGILHFTDEQGVKETVEILDRHYSSKQKESDFQIINPGGLPKGTPGGMQDGTRRAFGLE